MEGCSGDEGDLSSGFALGRKQEGGWMGKETGGLPASRK